MSNPSTDFASLERPVDLEGSRGVSEGEQLVGGKESIPATSSPKQGEEETGFDSLSKFDEDSLSYEVSVIPWPPNKHMMQSPHVISSFIYTKV